MTQTHIGRTTPRDDKPRGSRILALTMMACTFLGLVVAIGLMMRANLDPDRDGVADPSDAAVAMPVYHEGGDCSAGGISAEWDMRAGKLECVARDTVDDAHRPGEDCAQDGVVAGTWQFPNGRWICVAKPGTAAPQPVNGPAPAPGPAPPNGPVDGNAPAPPIGNVPAPPAPEYTPPPPPEFVPDQAPAYVPPPPAYEEPYVPPAETWVPESAPAPQPAPAPAPPVIQLPGLPPLTVPWLPPPPP